MEMILGIITVAVILYIIFKPKNNATTNGQNTNVNGQTVNTLNNQNLQNSQNNQEIPVAPVTPDPEPIVLSFDDTGSSKQNVTADNNADVSKQNENSDIAPIPPKNETFERLSFCPYCGKKLDGEFAFCPYCGKDLK